MVQIEFFAVVSAYRSQEVAEFQRFFKIRAITFTALALLFNLVVRFRIRRKVIKRPLPLISLAIALGVDLRTDLLVTGRGGAVVVVFVLLGERIGLVLLE